MILQVCAIFDSKVGTYGGLMLFRSAGEAIRQFTDMAADPSLPFAKHRGDYSLYALGSYDDNSGALGRLDSPSRIIGADELGE